MGLVDRTLLYLQERRDKVLNGGINSIPSPFKRFSSEFIGVEQGKYYICTANQKVGKTQFASYVFLYTPLLYAYEHQDQIRLKIFYYALEESPEDVLQRFISYLLNLLSKGTIRISPTDLQSSSNIPVEQEVLNKLEDGEYKQLLEFFEKVVEFPASRNPTGIYQDVKRYMEENGTTYKKKQKIKDEFGVTKEVDAFDYYEPNDPNEYVIVFVDHISLVSTERDLTLKKQACDKLSEYFVSLRNRYNVTPVLIQQQAAQSEGLEAFKLNKLKPSATNLSDTKYSARDCNVLLGIFSPFRHELPEYRGYDITRLRDNCRFLEVILNRGGSVGGIIGLFFDGVTCNWKELPRPDDKENMQKVYEYLNRIRNKPRKMFMLISNFIKFIQKQTKWEKL